VLSHGRVEGTFPRMPEWWVPDVVNQRECLDQVDTQSQLPCNRARDLRDFEGVGQPIAKVIRITAGKHLRFGLEPSERAGVNDSIPIALKVIAVGMGRLRMPASTRVLHRIACEHGLSVAKQPSAVSTQHSFRHYLCNMKAHKRKRQPGRLSFNSRVLFTRQLPSATLCPSVLLPTAPSPTRVSSAPWKALPGPLPGRPSCSIRRRLVPSATPPA